jgi:hypothetical protein
MEIKRIYKCDSLNETEFNVRIEFEPAEHHSEVSSGYDFIHISFDKGIKQLPEFKPGESYIFKFESTPVRILKINEEENLPPSMRID